MKSLHENFTQSTDKEKIDFIIQNAKHISNFLKKPITELKNEELDDVAKLAQVESSAEKVVNNLSKNLQDFINNYGSGIDIDPKILKPEQIKKVDEIYQNTIIKSVVDVIELLNNKDNALSADDLLNHQKAMNQTSSIFNGVEQFKNQVDEIYPDLTTTILTIATPAIACLLGPHAPILAAAVVLAPIAISIAKLLIDKIDFKSIFDKFFKTIDKLRGNEKLNEIYQAGEKVVEIAQVLDTSVSAVSKFNCTKEGAKEMLAEMEKNPKIKEVMTNVANFADQFITSSKSGLKTNIDVLVSETIEKFKEAGINNDNLEKIKTTYSKHAGIAKNKIDETFQQGSKILNKVSGVIQVVEELSKPEKMIGNLAKAAGIDQKALNVITKNFAEVMNNNFAAKANGNFNPKNKNDISAQASQISTALKNPSIQNFAKKQLGFNNASKILLENISKQSLSQAMVVRGK